MTSVEITGRPNTIEKVTNSGDFSSISGDKLIKGWSCGGEGSRIEKEAKKSKKSLIKFLERKKRSL